MKLYWRCPQCNHVINFTEEMQYLFSEKDDIGYEADFDPESGLYFHTIFCSECDGSWIISISPFEEGHI